MAAPNIKTFSQYSQDFPGSSPYNLMGFEIPYAT